jgi:hypothetical protein
MPISWNQTKRLWTLRCKLKKRERELRHQGIKDTASRLADVQLATIVKLLDDEFGGYTDYPGYPEDDVNRAWSKANHILMAATWPLVPAGRIPLEVRLQKWFKINVGIGCIYRTQATLWYKAVFWGFAEWRDYTYRDYWDRRDWKDEEQWFCDGSEQERLFVHWFQLWGYTSEQAYDLRLYSWRYTNE